MIDALIYLAVFIAGYLLCFFTRSERPREAQPREQTVLVARNKPSLRNPLRTSRVEYEEYKTSRGLYAAVKPKGDTENIEVGR